MTSTTAANRLTEIIRQQISTRGPMPFVEFMAQALYHPEHGYYMVPRQRIGKQGDFFTSSSVHALFGQLVARQLVQMWQLLDGGAFCLVEQGPGEGHFALDILTTLAAEAPDLYRQLDYVLLEVSEDNRQRQQALLHEHASRVRWTDFDSLAEIQGCFLSNELLDAFPVRLLEKHQGVLREIYVDLDAAGNFSESRHPPQDDAVDRHLAWLGIEPVEGQRFEVNLAAVDWMRRVAGSLKRGFILTIDYGYPADELYAPFRKDGTLMCYRKHRADENPLLDVGEKDITAHVDFSALQKAGDEAGLETLCCLEQYRFLLGLGFVEALMELQAKTTDEQQARALRLGLKNLIMPEGGMGETFKVLIQGKGMAGAQLLCQRDFSRLSAGF